MRSVCGSIASFGCSLLVKSAAYARQLAKVAHALAGLRSGLTSGEVHANPDEIEGRTGSYAARLGSPPQSFSFPCPQNARTRGIWMGTMVIVAG